MKKEKPTKPDMLDEFSRKNIFDSDDSYRYMYCTYVRINPTHNSICCGELWKPVRDCQRNWIEVKIIEIILVYILMTNLVAHLCHFYVEHETEESGGEVNQKVSYHIFVLFFYF